MTNKAKRKTTKPAETVRSVTKSAVLRSGRFHRFKDALTVILKDDEMYSIEDVRKLLKDFYQKEVN